MLNLSITLVIIVNYLCTMHREYHDFYDVHVYLRCIRISLLLNELAVATMNGDSCRVVQRINTVIDRDHIK